MLHFKTVISPVNKKLFQAVGLISVVAQLLFVTRISTGQINQDDQVPEGLATGTVAPMFSGLDQDSNTYHLADALENGPVVLIFYRGQWCPYCNSHLSAVQDSLQMIRDKGASVVAVSPERPDYLNKTIDKTGADFTLVYDEGYRISDAYGGTFTPNQRKLVLYRRLMGADFKQVHSDNSGRLPVPATYIISQDSVITWRHFDVNYKTRSSVKQILRNL